MKCNRNLMLLLAIILIASIFLPVTAHAESYPWDCVIVLSCDKVDYTYRLRDNLADISDWSKQSRGVYLSCRLRKQKIKQLTDNGYSLSEAVCYCLPHFIDFLSIVADKVEYHPTDATVKFINGAFKYTKEKTGRCIDTDELCNQIYLELSSDMRVALTTRILNPTITVAILKERTVLRSSFSTSYSSSGSSRSSNIALATANFASLTILPNQRVSFNQLVGERTTQRGYSVGKIIVDGKYVDGVGGGVCQVSTTLYNALLLADIKVNSRSRHSLVSSYVDPGFDAMVSSISDLVFTNNTQHNVYISAQVTKDKMIVFNVYGAKLPYKVVRESVITAKTPCKQQNIIDTQGQYINRVIYTDESFVLSIGSDAIKSKAYLKYMDGDRLNKRVLISQDSYMSTPRIVVWGAKQRVPTQTPIK